MKSLSALESHGGRALELHRPMCPVLHDGAYQCPDHHLLAAVLAERLRLRGALDHVRHRTSHRPGLVVRWTRVLLAKREASPLWLRHWAMASMAHASTAKASVGLKNMPLVRLGSCIWPGRGARRRGKCFCRMIRWPKAKDAPRELHCWQRPRCRRDSFE